jgi:hypothetical protein
MNANPKTARKRFLTKRSFGREVSETSSNVPLIRGVIEAAIVTPET